jgi:hypothetical protein
MKRKEVGGACGTNVGKERGIQDFSGNPERKRPPGRTRHRLKITMKWNICSHSSNL